MKKTLLALAASLLASPASADILVTNVNGMQVGADGKLQRFRALTIAPDGKVRQVIENPELVRLANITGTVDGGGKTLLPGLIDAHGHVIDSPGGGPGLGLLLLQLDLGGSKSLSDLLQRLRAYAQANPGTGWIVGRGWNQELWSDKKFPTAADIDAIVADRPVWLTRVDGHAAVGNSAAMRIAGISTATIAPAGGSIERDSAGRPSGLFVDSAIALVGSKVPQTTAEMMDRALGEAQQALLANGITAVADMGTSRPGWMAMQRAGQRGELQLRILSYVDGLEPLKQIPLRAPTDWLHGDHLRLAGVKLYSDGALGSRGAWLKTPYADKPDTRGLRFLTDAELQRQVNQAAGAGFQLAIHAIGDAANDQVIRAFEQANRTYSGDRRWRLEHAQVVDPADIPRLAPAGIIASMQPTHQTSDRTMAEARLGLHDLEGAYAWQSVLRSGAPLAFGSDFPVESPNPFPGLSAAISRQDMDARPPGGWIPKERLTFEQALHAFTRGAAYAGFAEDKIGSLEPGKWADFILIDIDPAKADAQWLARARVIETWVAGRKVWEIGGVAKATGERGR